MSARAWLLGGMLCLVGGRAWAQTRPEERTRSELLQRATQARAQRNWPEVVRLLREALDLRVTASVRLGLAGALVELGRHREAAHEAALCLQIAPVERDLRERARTEIVDACGLTLREASAHLATLTIETTSNHAAGVTLRVDGTVMEGFALGRPVYLEPGRRQLRLEAPGHIAVDQTETLRQGSTHSLRLPLTPRTEDNGPGAGAATPQATAARAPSRDGQPADVSVGSVLPWVLAGVGVVGVAVGGGFFALASSARDERDALCDASGCDPSAQDRDSRYRTTHLVGNVSTLVGAGLVVGGLGWWFWGRSRRSDRPQLSANLHPGQSQLILSGSW